MGFYEEIEVALLKGDYIGEYIDSLNELIDGKCNKQTTKNKLAEIEQSHYTYKTYLYKQYLEKHGNDISLLKEDIFNSLEGFIKAKIEIETEVINFLTRNKLPYHGGRTTPYIKATEILEYLTSNLDLHFEHLKNNYPSIYTDIKEEINNRLMSEPLITYDIKRAKSYLPMLHGKATDTIATMTRAKSEYNPINKTTTINKNDVKIAINELDRTAGTLGITTHKLLSTAIANFSNINHTGENKRELRNLKVYIPLKEYAIMCGYDVIEHEQETQEETEKEIKRAKSSLDKFRRNVKKDLDLLFNATLSWSENIKGKPRDFIDMRIIGAKGIKNGYIYMSFTQEIAEYLIQLPLTQYPTALLALDGKKTRAYLMGYKMAEHYNMYNNQLANTAQILKVSTLLSYADYPSIDSSTAKIKGWKVCIKEPFEDALEVLYTCGLLSDYEYVRSKGAPLTDEEKDQLTEDFKNWSENTYIKFTLADAPKHSTRIETIQEQKRLETINKKKK